MQIIVHTSVRSLALCQTIKVPLKCNKLWKPWIGVSCCVRDIDQHLGFCLTWRMENCIKCYCCCVWLWERERYRATISAPSNPDHPPSQHRGRQLLSLTTSIRFFLVRRFFDIFSSHQFIHFSFLHLPPSSIQSACSSKFLKILVYPHGYFCKITQLWEKLKGTIGCPFTWKW